MVTKEVVLKYVDRQERRGRLVTVDGVARAFVMPEYGAAAHLERLWRNELIETPWPRRRGYKYRLDRGEHMQEFEFRLSPKGRDRLAWGWRPWAKIVSADPLF
jgi:hypothetical protein